MPTLIQNTLQPLYEMKKLRGIDNLATDDLRLDSGFVRVAENVDIDSEMMARRKVGILQQILSGNAHSGWSDEDKLCFLVKDNDLIQILRIYKIGGIWFADYQTVLAGVGSSKMSFVKVGDRVFFSNLMVTGYIQNGVAHGFPPTTRADRQRMVGGNLIEYHPPRLYAAQEDFLWRSIAGNPFEMNREGDWIYYPGPWTMLVGVNGPHGENGIYGSAGGKCFYMSNLEPNLYEARYKPLLDVPALPGSAVKIGIMDIGRLGGLEGDCVVWSTCIGIFMGFAGGYVKDLTSKHYAVLDIEEGFSFVKYHLGYRQYVFVGQAQAGLGLAEIEITDPMDIIEMQSS